MKAAEAPYYCSWEMNATVSLQTAGVGRLLLDVRIIVVFLRATVHPISILH